QCRKVALRGACQVARVQLERRRLMPKISKHPKLRVHVKRGKSGQVWTSYSYDMRGTGEKDIPLGRDLAAALKKWDELHNERPRTAGTLEEAFRRWESEVLPNYESDETRRG